jgi:hypothetical protein
MAVSKNHYIAAALVVAILVAVINLVRTCKPVEEEFDLTTYGGLGGFAATKAIEYLGGNGSVVLILFDDSVMDVYGKDQYALTETIKQSGCRIKSIELVSPGPLRTNPAAIHSGVLPLDELRRIENKYPNVDALLCFAGAPVLSDEARPERATDAPKLIIANPVGESGVFELIESGYVSMAVVHRRDAAVPAEFGGVMTVEELEEVYEVVTHEEYAESNGF